MKKQYLWLLLVHNTRGHRRQSFVAQDLNELVELRARQRTFHGAYSRTALGSLGYGITILRLLDKSYHLSELCITYAPFILFYGVRGRIFLSHCFHPPLTLRLWMPEHHSRLLLEPFAISVINFQHSFFFTSRITLRHSWSRIVCNRLFACPTLCARFRG